MTLFLTEMAVFCLPIFVLFAMLATLGIGYAIFVLLASLFRKARS